MTLTIALAGNPNVGKSTIFNALTGSRQHVGNWPGKTVEKKEGRLRLGAEEILVVDLPGAYSLTAYSLEEIIARDFIVHEQPTAVVAVVDAANLERNLYLVAQILELGAPLIVALNMTDVATSRGLKIDANRLSQRLGGVPVVETVGNRSLGLDQLKEAMVQVSQHPPHALPQVQFSGVLGAELAGLEAQIAADDALSGQYNVHWLATKLLENDTAVLDALHAQGKSDLVETAVAAQARIAAATGEDAETLIADQRYAFIGAMMETVLQRPSQAVLTASDKIDAIVTHRIWGLPIFLLLMWLVFQFTANVSAPFLDWVDVFINETVYGWGGALMAALGLGDTWLAALVTDGVIAGVGGVLVFVPVLLFLYFALAVLEDSGYMARAAFVMDRVMRWMGLHGKSFLPMIIGFGCTVPAVYATRTLENEKDRKLTGFLATFMSCGARLPVYVVFWRRLFRRGFRQPDFCHVYPGHWRGPGDRLCPQTHRLQRAAPGPLRHGTAPLPRPAPARRVAADVGTGRRICHQGGYGDSGRFHRHLAANGHPRSGQRRIVQRRGPGREPLWRGQRRDCPRLPARRLWQLAGLRLAHHRLPGQGSGGGHDEYHLRRRRRSGCGRGGTDDLYARRRGVAAGLWRSGRPDGARGHQHHPRTINLLPFVEIGEVNFFGGAEEEESTTRLESALVNSFTESAGSPALGALAALAFNVFVLLYVPCMVAVAAMRQEFGGRWMWMQIGYTLALAWIAAVLVFQVGKLFV
jgi:ferrous iron transporter FeoB